MFGRRWMPLEEATLKWLTRSTGSPRSGASWGTSSTARRRFYGRLNLWQPWGGWGKQPAGEAREVFESLGARSLARQANELAGESAVQES